MHARMQRAHARQCLLCCRGLGSPCWSIGQLRRSPEASQLWCCIHGGGPATVAPAHMNACGRQAGRQAGVLPCPFYLLPCDHVMDDSHGSCSSLLSHSFGHLPDSPLAIHTDLWGHRHRPGTVQAGHCHLLPEVRGPSLFPGREPACKCALGLRSWCRRGGSCPESSRAWGQAAAAGIVLEQGCEEVVNQVGLLHASSRGPLRPTAAPAHAPAHPRMRACTHTRGPGRRVLRLSRVYLVCCWIILLSDLNPLSYGASSWASTSTAGADAEKEWGGKAWVFGQAACHENSCLCTKGMRTSSCS